MGQNFNGFTLASFDQTIFAGGQKAYFLITRLDVPRYVRSTYRAATSQKFLYSSNRLQPFHIFGEGATMNKRATPQAWFQSHLIAPMSYGLDIYPLCLTDVRVDPRSGHPPGR